MYCKAARPALFIIQTRIQGAFPGIKRRWPEADDVLHLVLMLRMIKAIAFDTSLHKRNLASNNGGGGM
jgi:hypothetical protein